MGTDPSDTEPAPDQGRRALELRVLGECRVVGAGVDQSAPSIAQRRLLQRLALAPPGVGARVEEVAEAVWERDPPRHFKATIQNQVSRLRATYGDGVVLTLADGYALGVPSDADRVREGAAAAERLLETDPEAARALADEVVGRWRGTPYADLDHVDRVHGPRRALAAAYRSARDTRLAAAIALERSAWALPEAEMLAAESPLDERRQALLVRALAVSGRRGDALAAVVAARRRLRDELGIEPGALLLAAEQDVLRPTERAVLPATPVELVGREQELRSIIGGLARNPVVTVVGEPGAGVTRLLAEAAGQMRRLGVRTVATSTREHQDSAVSLLRALLDEDDPGARGVVAGFADLVAAQSDRQPVALLVDDADELGPTARRVLVEAAAPRRVLVVLGRHGPVDATEGEPTGEVVELRPLDRDAVASIAVARLEGDLTPDDLDRLVAACGGNPLLLEALLSGPPAPGASTSRLGDLARLFTRGLDEHERWLLERAAVAGDGFPRVAVPGLGATGIADLVAVDADGAISFRHGALRDAVYHDISPARREELHAELARAARASGATSALVARQLLAAGHLAGGAAMTACRETAADAARHGAHADAVEWLHAALGIAGLEDRDQLELRIEMGDAQRLAGNPAHVDTLLEAAREALRRDDEELVAASCSALLELGGTTSSGLVVEGIPELVTTALARLRTPSLRAVVCGAASLAGSLTGDAGRSKALFDEAEALAVGDLQRAKVLPFAYMALGMPGDLSRRRALTEELAATARRSDDPAALFESWQLRYSVAIADGDGPALREAVAEMGRLLDVVGDVGRRWAHRFALAAVAHLDGDDEASERLADQACSLFAPVSQSRAFAAQAGQLFALRMTQGRVAELADTLVVLVEAQPGVPAWRAAHALAAVAAGDAEVAREQAALALDLAQEDGTWLAAHVVGARAAALAGDSELARRHVERLEPWSGITVFQGTCCYGPVDTALAMLHDLMGDATVARQYAARAVASAERLGARPFVAEAQRWVTR